MITQEIVCQFLNSDEHLARLLSVREERMPASFDQHEVEMMVPAERECLAAIAVRIFRTHQHERRNIATGRAYAVDNGIIEHAIVCTLHAAGHCSACRCSGNDDARGVYAKFYGMAAHVIEGCLRVAESVIDGRSV